MEIADVSTRPVAEIDLERSGFPAGLSRHSPASPLSDYEDLAIPSTESPVLPSGVLPIAEEEQEQCDVIVCSTSSVFRPLRAIQVKNEAASGEKLEGGGQVSFRASLGDVASFVRRTYAREEFSGVTHSPAADRQTRVYVKALTNWLRSIADDEPSRPILDIEEGSVSPVRAIKAKTESMVSISSGLRRKEPKTTTTGLGHVSAGLLLWLESSNESEEDA